ncbi:MAG: recombinase family protein [Oscillospiraceae bacterium]|nr:recombinase family protein [Oscillospiraceae bacterium]
MGLIRIHDKASFSDALEHLQPGDCVEAESFTALADTSRELLANAVKLAGRGAELRSLAEGVDTRLDGSFFTVCRALYALDRKARKEKQQAGIEKAKEDGKYAGRKPIEVDMSLFDEVVARWQAGEITAKTAMEQLHLKPNTFYRRIKERKEQTMKDLKKVEKELRAEVKEAARQSRKDMDELKKQVRSEAKELKQSAEDALSVHDVRKEMVRDRARAEADYGKEVRQLKKDVEAEAKEFKKLVKE